MKYIDPKADLRWWIPTITRKAVIIVLLGILLVIYTFTGMKLRAATSVQTQTVISVEEVPITKQQMEKQQEAPKAKAAEVVETDDEKEIDTVKIIVSDFNPDLPPPVISSTNNDEAIDWVKVESKPTVVSTVRPRYPEIAHRSNTEGAVIIEFIIDTTGLILPGSAKVVQAKPEGLFDDAALEAIAQWRFTPGMQRDRKVRVKWRQPIRFTLTNR